MNRRGRFLTFEGIDGAGKSSHVEAVGALLRARGLRVVVTREPGGTELAEAVRDWVLHRPMSMRVEALLVFAARQDHLDRVIRPALADGTWVVCDRFTDSTVAYQGGGRGMPMDDIVALERWVHADLRPDRTWLFDIPPEVAAGRRRAVRAEDRFEAEAVSFFERVRGAYLHRAAGDPARVLTLDATRPIDEIRALLEKDLATL